MTSPIPDPDEPRRYRGRVSMPVKSRDLDLATLDGLVGWGAKATAPPLLRTCAAWEVATWHLLALLPDCQECGCL